MSIHGMYLTSLHACVLFVSGLLFAVNTSAQGYNYTEALGDALSFYEAQRSGKLPSDNRITWRGDSALNDEYDGKDLTGGYYDAGDYLKITFPLCFSMSQLAWSMLEFRTAYEDADQLEHAERTLQWGLDWLLKAHIEEDKLVVMVGDPEKEHNSWERIETMTSERPAVIVSRDAPGADVWAQCAAAMAAGAIVYKNQDDYSKRLLDSAKELYSFAINGKYSDSVYSDTMKGNASQLYKSTRSNDDLVWAGMWLYEATGDHQYKTDANEGYFTALNNRWLFVDVPRGDNACNKKDACYWSSVRVWNWDNSYPGAMVMLAAVSNSNQTIWADVYNWLDAWADGDEVIDVTSKGLSCMSCRRCGWGANRDAANAAFLALIASKYIENDNRRNKYRCWAQKQMDYFLGDSGRSLVVGFGDNPPNMVHHRGASCPVTGTCGFTVLNDLKRENPNVITGALVSGQCGDIFKDDRTNYRTNEVALDKNTGFTGALAGLIEPTFQCRRSFSNAG